MIAPRLRIRLPSAPKDGTPSQRQWFAAVTNWINAVVDDTQAPVAETQDKVTRRSLQIDMVDNTPDLEKPLSQAAQARFTAIQESLSRLTASTSVTVISDWDVAATSATPTTAKSGMYFRATTAGTVGAVPLNIGDVVLFYLDNTGALQWIIVDSPAERSAAYTPADWAATTGVARIENKPTLFGLSSLLDGLAVGTNVAIAATDSLIIALANLQAQIAFNNGRVIPSGGTTGQILSKNSATDFDVSWGAKPIGLVQLTEQYSNTAPNNSIPVTGFKPASGTNVDYVLSPLGTGSVLARMPDNTVTGGNKRGINSVDLQTTRNAAIQVASGSYSTLLGGAYNIAAGAYSVAAGFACTAGPAGVAMGYYGQARNYTAWIYGHGLSSGGGREQIAHYPLNLGTSSTTATALNLGYSGAGTGVGTIDYLNIPASFTFAFDAVITARSGSDTAVWDVRGVVARNATGNCYLVGTPTTTQRAATAGASSWALTVQTSTLGLQFIATGPAAACRWNGTVKTLETYGT